MKLTLLSKILLSVFTIGILSTIIYFSFSTFKISKNQCLLNTKTGTIIDKPGFYCKNFYYHKKFDNKTNLLEGQAIIQGKTQNIKAFLFAIKYEYDLKWISTNKCIPEKIYFLEHDFDTYMLNASKELSDEELSNRKLLIDILTFFYQKSLINSGYKIIKIYIFSPIMPVNSPINLYKNK